MLQQWGVISSSTQETTWTQPVLSANGTLGSSSFAVYASSEYSSGYAAWKAFDGSTNTYYEAASSATTGQFIFYNPLPLKVTTINITNRNSNYYQIKGGTVYGSNDNSSWTSLCTFSGSHSSGATWAIDVNSSSFYYYYKIDITSADGGFAAVKMQITATQQIAKVNKITFPISYSNTGYSFTLGFVNENNTAYATAKKKTYINLYNPSSTNGLANWYTIGY